MGPSTGKHIDRMNIVQINFDKEEKQMRNGLENKDCMQVGLQIGQLDSPDYPKEHLSGTDTNQGD